MVSCQKYSTTYFLRFIYLIQIVQCILFHCYTTFWFFKSESWWCPFWLFPFFHSYTWWCKDCSYSCTFAPLLGNFSREQWLNYSICISSVLLDIAKIAFQSGCTNLYCYQLTSGCPCSRSFVWSGFKKMFVKQMGM